MSDYRPSSTSSVSTSPPRSASPVEVPTSTYTSTSAPTSTSSPDTTNVQNHEHHATHLQAHADHSHADLDEQEHAVADYDVQAGQRPIREATALEVRRAVVDDDDYSSSSPPSPARPSSSSPPRPDTSCSNSELTICPPLEPDSPDSPTSSPIPASTSTKETSSAKVRASRKPGMTTFVDVDGFRYTRDWDTGLSESDFPKDARCSSSSPAPTPTPITWTEFSPLSPSDPLHYPLSKKYFISTTACLFTLWTSFNASSYAIGEGSMERDLKVGRTEAAAGLALYAWGFAVFPMVLAPFSEEFGRRPMYIIAGLIYWLFHFAVAKANSIVTVLVFRFLQGGAGSVGSTLVGGTLADIWPASQRGGKMAVFALMAITGTAVAPVFMSWVEANPRLEWRWIQWIQIIIVGAYLPVLPFLPETRAAVLLRKQAAKMRRRQREVRERQGGAGGDGVNGSKQGEKESVGVNGGGNGGEAEVDLETIYLARGEVGKPKLAELMKVSMIRPFHLLATEPIVIFFTLWISVAWAVMYGLVQSIPYVFQNVYGFETGRVGLVYLSLTIGGFAGYGFNFVQEYFYNTRVQHKGAEARLYSAMFAGVAMAAGCFIYAWTTFSHITYVAPCIGIAIIMGSVYTIYLACFNYLADGYSLYASSALAGQSLVRNLIGGSFPLFANPLYENLNPNWASTLFGAIGALLAVVPFIGFFYGPQIRARSKFSKLLMEEEQKAAEAKEGRESRAEPA